MFKIFFKILGALPLQAFLNEFKNRFTTALLQRGPFRNVHCRVAAHSSCNYSGSPVLEGFKVLFVTYSAAAPHTYTVFEQSSDVHFTRYRTPIPSCIPGSRHSSEQLVKVVEMGCPRT